MAEGGGVKRSFNSLTDANGVPLVNSLLGVPGSFNEDDGTKRRRVEEQ